MRDHIRKLFVLGAFCTSVAGLWTLGAIKADLDRPSTAELRVDPAIVRAALLADPSVDMAYLRRDSDSAASWNFLFAG